MSGILCFMHTSNETDTLVSQEISVDAYVASVTMILNGVNSFLFQLVLLPLYTLIAFQKTVVCTVNDVFGLFDATGFVLRVGRMDLQNASDVSSGICLSAFYDGQLNQIGQPDSQDGIGTAGSDFLRDAGQAGSSFLVSGDTFTEQGAKGSKTVQLLGGSSLSRQRTAANAPKTSTAKVPSSATQKGGKDKTLFSKFMDSNVVKKLTGVVQKLQMKTPIHLVDSMITYAIGVVSGLQDMAQVRGGICVRVPGVLFYSNENVGSTLHLLLFALIISASRSPMTMLRGCPSPSLFCTSSLSSPHSLSISLWKGTTPIQCLWLTSSFDPLSLYVFMTCSSAPSANAMRSARVKESSTRVSSSPSMTFEVTMSMLYGRRHMICSITAI